MATPALTVDALNVQDSGHGKEISGHIKIQRKLSDDVDIISLSDISMYASPFHREEKGRRLLDMDDLSDNDGNDGSASVLYSGELKSLMMPGLSLKEIAGSHVN